MRVLNRGLHPGQQDQPLCVAGILARADYFARIRVSRPPSYTQQVNRAEIVLTREFENQILNISGKDMTLGSHLY